MVATIVATCSNAFYGNAPRVLEAFRTVYMALALNDRRSEFSA